MSAPARLRIATRKSPLALWQAEHVAAGLRGLQAGLQVDFVERTTKGDRILDQQLSKIGGKDLFVKEISDALLTGDADLAVHSLKDVPTELPAALAITAYPPREDPRDALVGRPGVTFATLAKGARIGTSSLRRAAQLLMQRPDLVIVPVRGNVQTRIGRIEKDDLQAVVLAYAGLKRLGFESRVTEILPPSVSLPAIGQGILAIETRKDDADTNLLVARLDDRDARAAAVAERAFLRELRGGCQVPIAAHATLSGDTLALEGLVASTDGKESFRARTSGSRADAEALGTGLAKELIRRGAGKVLESLRAPS